jgi:mannan endo-1,4-beta-mannosidase
MVILTAESPLRTETVHEPQHNLSWITVNKSSSYFQTAQGEDWTPIGHNDAITWPGLKGLFGRKDTAGAEAYIKNLRNSGVTCIRLMLEYCHTCHRYLERPAGRFQPNMLRLWDDIFALCALHGMRILLTPYDTFWMKKRWAHHPYNIANGGPCTKRSHWLLCPETRKAIKNRLEFATERWGPSGVLFAWDLWNEIQPAHGGNSVNQFASFITDISGFLRKKEIALHGRAHLQTVSLFGTTLAKDLRVVDCIYRHPSLDFVNIHLYEKSINAPRNTIDAAISTGNLTREILGEIRDGRPFFDSEHGPIHSFSTRKKILHEPFDDEYFRHMQWAHFASGGAGGGMRWPYRHPHVLTPGMHKAQLALSRFLPLISFKNFTCRNLNNEIINSDKKIKVFGCGDKSRMIVWLLRTGGPYKNGMLKKDVLPKTVTLKLPGLHKGTYRVVTWDTVAGTAIDTWEVEHDNDDSLVISLTGIRTDLAFSVTSVFLSLCSP